MENIKVKVCGIKKENDVKMCMDLGVDVLGFVVEYPIPVPWNLNRKEATPLLKALKPPHKSCIVTGGEPEKVIELATILKPSIIQLHYRETLKDTTIIANTLKKQGIEVIKTVPPVAEERIFQFGTEDIERIVKSLCETNIYGLLVDSRVPSNAFGDGLELDIKFCMQVMSLSTKPVITAGGINPDNVCDFIKKTGTKFIDVMTGVEKSPGEKDKEMLSRLLSLVHNI